MVRKIILILILCFSFFTPVLKVQGSSIDTVFDLKIEKINPDSILPYKIKRLKEKVILALKFSPNSKIKYYQILADKRLVELKYIADYKNKAHIEKTSQRYETTVGELVEFLKANALVERKKDILVGLERHRPVLEELKSNFIPDTAERRFIMNDINSLGIYLGQLTSF